ncbi:MAG: hypothetical protein JW928_02830, partial [Candidatus Aureabacteria bacterium]|nr:hypothetical protein [Candidatus Auribacterota bacterium]
IIAIFAPVIFHMVAVKNIRKKHLVFYIKGTTIRFYHDNEGNLAFTINNRCDLGNTPNWQITKNKTIPWYLFNFLTFYLELLFYL